MPDIFISYTRSDAAVADEFVHYLEAQGFDVWWDDHLTVGKSYHTEILRVLQDSKATIVLWSANSNQSKWVFAEGLVAAVAGRLIPVRIDATPLPTEWVTTQALMVQDHLAAADDTTRSRLLAAIGEKTGRRRLVPRRKNERPTLDQTDLESLSAKEEAAYQAGVGGDFGRALYRLARDFAFGQGGQHTDEAHAILLMRIASTFGNRHANWHLASLLAQPHQPSHLRILATSHLTFAANDGLPAAQYNLGVHLMDQFAILQDAALAQQARSWFLQAAESGLAKAQYNSAQMLFEGIGGPQSLNEGLKWLHEAASQLYPDACIDLALMIANGECPPVRDVRTLVEAAMLGVKGDQERAYVLGKAREIGALRPDLQI